MSFTNGDLMDPETSLEILHATERTSVGALILHGLLAQLGLPDHARLALSIHEEAAVSAETIGGILEVAVRVK